MGVGISWDINYLYEGDKNTVLVTLNETIPNDHQKINLKVVVMYG